MSEVSGDIHYYVEPPWEPKPAGVEKGYLVLRYGDEMTAEVADMALLHDGEGTAVGQIDQDSWRQGEIRESE